MTGQWRAIPGFEGWYEVSDRGHVRRVMPERNASVGRLLRFGSTRHGYRIAKLCVQGKVRGFTVHSLVALAFLGPRPIGHQVNHIDGDKMNNAASNLEHVSPAENIEHAKRLGLFRSGTNHPNHRGPR